MGSEGKLSRRPPSLGKGDASLEAFIGGAGVQTPEPAAPAPVWVTPKPAAASAVAPGPYPWAAPGVWGDVAKVFDLRLPEPYLLKLKYIADAHPGQHAAVLSERAVAGHRREDRGADRDR